MLKEAEAFLVTGVKDILYIVGIVAARLSYMTVLRR